MWGTIVFLTSMFAATAGAVVWLLGYFGDRRTHPWFVQTTCFVAFFFPFTIVVLLPLDLATTRYNDCLQQALAQTCEPPLFLVSRDFLYGFWVVAYWITFNAQIFVIPIMQGYVRSGEITFFRRLRAGIMDNIFFYALCGGVGVIFILYAIFGLKVSPSLLLTLAIPASNAYGLMLLTIMMGYGLVEVPRGLWYNANVNWVLKYLEYQAPKLKEACVDSEAEIYEVARLVGHASRKITVSDPLRPLVDRLMEKCPLALQHRNVVDEDDDLPAMFTRTTLVDLHARIKRAAFLNQRDQAQLRYLFQRAFLCQDIIANEMNPDAKFRSIVVTVPNTDAHKDVKLRVLWWWFVWIKPITMRLLCIICVISSLLVVWSESTFQITSTTLSIPALFLDSTTFSYASLELVAILFLFYMCVCTYSTLITINLFDIYQMVPEHHTDEVSLLFVGAYLCKLTFPLCYNFLNMGGQAEGKRVSNSTFYDYSAMPVFIQYLGPAVNLTPLFGVGYNDWVALLVLIMCVVIGLNVHGRILAVFRLEVFYYRSFRGGGDGRGVNETEEGHGVIEQARALEERKIQLGQQVGDSGGVSGSGGGGHHADAFGSTSRARNARELLDRYKTRGRDGLAQPVSADRAGRSGAASSSSSAAGSRAPAAPTTTRNQNNNTTPNDIETNTETTTTNTFSITNWFNTKPTSSNTKSDESHHTGNRYQLASTLDTDDVQPLVTNTNVNLSTASTRSSRKFGVFGGGAGGVGVSTESTSSTPNRALSPPPPPLGQPSSSSSGSIAAQRPASSRQPSTGPKRGLFDNL